MGDTRNCIYKSTEALADAYVKAHCHKDEARYKIAVVYAKHHAWQVPPGETEYIKTLAQVMYARTLPLARCLIAQMCLRLSDTWADSSQSPVESVGWHCTIAPFGMQWWDRRDVSDGFVYFLGTIHGPLVYRAHARIRYTQGYTLWAAAINCPDDTILNHSF